MTVQDGNNGCVVDVKCGRRGKEKIGASGVNPKRKHIWPSSLRVFNSCSSLHLVHTKQWALRHNQQHPRNQYLAPIMAPQIANGRALEQAA